MEATIKKKTKTRTTENAQQQATFTPNNPAFVQPAIENLSTKISETFNNVDPSKLAPGMTSLQTQALGGAANLGRPSYGGGGGGGMVMDTFADSTGGGQSARDAWRAGLAPRNESGFGKERKTMGGPAGGLPESTGMAPQAYAPADPFDAGQNAIQRGLSGGPQSVDRVNIADSIASFMNPYMKDVVDTSLADFDFGAGVSRAQGQLARAGDETFGGSSGALQAALTEGELGRGRGSLSASLRSGGFDRASALAAQQAGLDSGRNLTNAGFREQALNRNIQGGTALGNLGATRGAEDRANVQTKFGLGEAQRQIEKEQGNASIDALLKQISAFSGLPLDILKGYTTSGTSSSTGTSTTKQSGATLADFLNFMSANAAAAAKASGGG